MLKDNNDASSVNFPVLELPLKNAIGDISNPRKGNNMHNAHRKAVPPPIGAVSKFSDLTSGIMPLSLLPLEMWQPHFMQTTALSFILFPQFEQNIINSPYFAGYFHMNMSSASSVEFAASFLRVNTRTFAFMPSLNLEASYCDIPSFAFGNPFRKRLSLSFCMQM